jgi:hypothetical protein
VFQHDQEIENVEKSFSASMPQSGDINQDQQLSFFSGKMVYTGKHTGTSQQFPANSPILQTKITIQLSEFAGIDASRNSNLFKRLTGTWRYARGLSSTKLEQFIRKKWIDTTVSFDLTQVPSGLDNQQIILKPGYKYSVTAYLDLYANYTRGIINNENIAGFAVKVTSTQVTSQSVSYPLRNRAIINYKFHVNDRSYETVSTVSYNIFSFFSAVGGAFALMSVGMILLKLVQIIVKPRSILEDIQKQDEQVQSNKHKRILSHKRLLQRKDQSSVSDTSNNQKL